ncbi:MAG: FAD-dependent oxidoreductase, partial [Nitriliruptorales bacterium]
RIAGAVYSRTTMSGDSALFSRRLAEKAAEHGATFQLGTRIVGLVVSEGRIRGVDTDAGLIEADRYILAAGVGSRRIAKSAGLDLPIYPVKGYTLTLPVAAGVTAPTMSGIDEDRLVAWSRFGDRLRMTGTADFAGHDLSVNEEDARAIFRSGRELFPDAVRWDERELRSGLRPVTPDENPYLGPTDRYPELLLNTGHGNLGWVMAAGSARIVADLALGKEPDLDPVEFDATAS